MLACTLLLQKPHAKSKAKEHDQALERRLRAWVDGDIEGLLREGRTIQTFLTQYHAAHLQKQDEKRNAKVFAGLMAAGRIPAAIRMLSKEDNNGVLPLGTKVSSNKTGKDILKEKHPPPGVVMEGGPYPI